MEEAPLLPLKEYGAHSLPTLRGASMSAEHLNPELHNYALKLRSWKILAKSPRVFSYRQFTVFLEGLRRSIPSATKKEATAT